MLTLLKNNYINAYQSSKQISNNMILGQEYESVVSDSDSIYIKSDINDLENLKYISSKKVIYIKKVKVIVNTMMIYII